MSVIKRYVHTTIHIVLLVLTVTACASRSANAVPISRADAAVQEVAIATLAEKLKVGPSSIKVVSVSKADWRNSSLGCPKPGEMYSQIMSPGHVVVLEVGEQEYNVHMAGSRALVCDSPR